MKKIYLLLILSIVALSGCSQPPAEGFVDWKSQAHITVNEDEIRCGSNTILGEAKKVYEENYCGEYRRSTQFDPMNPDSDKVAKEICEIGKAGNIKERLIDRYNSISCPQECPVKTGPEIIDPVAFCKPVGSGSTVECDSKLNFRCEKISTPTPFTETPNPCPSPIKMPDIVTGQAPISGVISTFGDGEVRCQSNEISINAKKIYRGQYCEKKWKSEFFDPLQPGEEIARDLCEKGDVKEKLFDGYNSINCPQECPMKILTKVGDPSMLCDPLRIDSMLECNLKIQFSCENCPSPTPTIALPTPTSSSTTPTRDPALTPTPTKYPVLTPAISPSVTPTSDPVLTPALTPLPSIPQTLPTAAVSAKQFGCCVVCRVDDTGNTFFPSGSYTMTKEKCDSYNQNTDDYFAGHYFWSKDQNICPIKGPPIEEYEIGSEIDKMDMNKLLEFCAAFGKVPRQ